MRNRKSKNAAAHKGLRRIDRLTVCEFDCLLQERTSGIKAHKREREVGEKRNKKEKKTEKKISKTERGKQVQADE